MEEIVWEGRTSWFTIISFWNIVLGLFTMGMWLIIPILRILYTKYDITNQRIKLTKGILSRQEHQLDYVRIKDINYRQGLFGRIFNYGDIRIASGDISHPVKLLRGIPNPRILKESIRDHSEARRIERKVSINELM